MRKLYILLLSLCSVHCWAQEPLPPTNSSRVTTISTESAKSISAYRFWFNDNLTTTQTVSVNASSTATINTDIDISTLNEGINTISLQIKDNTEQWSGTIRQYFLNKKAGNNPSKYQYWFNTDYANAVTENHTTPTGTETLLNINVQSLNDGLNVFNVRFSDNYQKWSSTLSQFFYKTKKGLSSTPTLQFYQYWIDGDLQHATKESLNGNQQELLLTGIDLSAVQNGFHTFSIRFADDKGLWSAVQQSYFLKSSVFTQTKNGMSQFQYWFGTDIASVQSITILDNPTVAALNYEIDFSAKPKGDVYFNYRSRDQLGLWSVVNTAKISNNNSTGNLSIGKTDAFNIYPNPTDNFVFIEFGQEISHATVSIEDMNGREMYRNEFRNCEKEKINLNITSGIYFLKIKTPEISRTFKLLKK